MEALYLRILLYVHFNHSTLTTSFSTVTFVQRCSNTSNEYYLLIYLLN